jgi:hypothetical protein
MSSGTLIFAALVVGWISGMFTAAAIISSDVPTPRKNTRRIPPRVENSDLEVRS